MNGSDSFEKINRHDGTNAQVKVFDFKQNFLPSMIKFAEEHYTSNEDGKPDYLFFNVAWTCLICFVYFILIRKHESESFWTVINNIELVESKLVLRYHNVSVSHRNLGVCFKCHNQIWV